MRVCPSCGAENPDEARFCMACASIEQHAQSMSLWSPDGSAFVYAGESELGETGVWIQPATQDIAPVHLADGVFASWSPA